MLIVTCHILSSLKKMLWEWISPLELFCGVFVFIRWHAAENWQEMRLQSGLDQEIMLLHGQHLKPLHHLK